MIVDLSHAIEHGMVTYHGLPAPAISEFLSREASRAHYSGGTEFSIGRIDMVANTGTYVDAPFHRYAEGVDLAALPLESLADLPGVVVRGPLDDVDVRGKAVLIHTGWDRHWRTERYWSGEHPFLSRAAAERLIAGGAVFAGIDSYNIDNTKDGTRPAHTLLLGAGIPICEHMTNLAALPSSGFRFFAVPVKVRGLGSFPVRAFAITR
jgi:kynurenine formamidase